MSQMKRVRAAIMRGGTSKAVFLMENDLPRDKAERDSLICKIFGSPDVRQIDGLGGADPLTSKLAIIGPASRADADVDYTFGQVSINKGYIDYSGNCGNISSAVGPFAIQEGLVRAGEKLTTVRIHNTNTGKMIIADVPMADGEVAVLGDCVCDGVPGTGAKIMLDWSDTSGSVTGKLLPTGNPTDVVDIPGFGPLTVSIVDAANPMVFVRAKDLKLTGIETPQQVNTNADLLKLLETIRGTAAVMIGMAKDTKEALDKCPAFPMIAFVSPPADYEDFTTGRPIKASDVDLISRLMFMQVIHKTYAGTGTICTGAAARIPGTVVHEATNPKAEKIIRIGHPAGVIDIEVTAAVKNGKVDLTRAAISRTARRLMDGYAYICNN
ncbi:MAG: PrpF domain-containing protein [Negativicutes bacterium]|nr:PrpF domain-containing protein [Negativicutes bacterium]